MVCKLKNFEVDAMSKVVMDVRMVWIERIHVEGKQKKGS